MGAVDNLVLSGAEIYIEGVSAGAIVGAATISYVPRLRSYYSGYPATLRGNEVTGADFSIYVPYAEITARNLRTSIADATTQTINGSNFIKFGTNTQPVVYANVVFHQYNHVSGQHLVAVIWKAQVTSESTISIEHDASNFVVIGTKFTALKDSAHPASPLGYIAFLDSFDINNLPEGPSNG